MPSPRKILGGLSLGMAAFFLPITGAWAEAPEAPLMEAQLRAFKPVCSSTDLRDVMAAVSGASQVLESRCRLRLRWLGSESLPLGSAWCHLPAEPQARSKALQGLATKAKGGHARELALFLLPTRADERISWAVVDASQRSACDSPQEPRFLPRFGQIFFTDLSWMQGAPKAHEAPPSLASLLVAHEVLHSLTQRPHPTDAPRGSVMADHVTDIGPTIDPDWCACARQSPYASLVPSAP